MTPETREDQPIGVRESAHHDCIGDFLGALSETCGFPTKNYLGFKFGQMAIFWVLYQKHVVFPN